jgi:hypothetical protein
MAVLGFGGTNSLRQEQKEKKILENPHEGTCVQMGWGESGHMVMAWGKAEVN